MSNSTDKEAN